MVSIDEVRKSNSQITSLYGTNLVAVFVIPGNFAVGGTSGIGETTARAFICNTKASRVYLIGRDQERASRIIEELQQLEPSATVNFIATDVSLLREVDRACHEIQRQEDLVNILFLSPGVGTATGRDETDEGLDKKLNLHYYSRMRFIANLLPQLTPANAKGEKTVPSRSRLSRVISVLEAGGEASIDFDDLSLKTNYSLRNCAKHAITMNSLSMEYLAASFPRTAFIHSFPGIVRTRLGRDFGTFTTLGLNALLLLAKPWEIPLAESGERHLYAATCPLFSPRNGNKLLDLAEGSDGNLGSGFYRLASDGSTYKSSKVMQRYREYGSTSQIWDHTRGVFAKVLVEKSC
ncbi:hypothetical protein N7533_008959 [Penicillium manginii]|uniref:uncharacterized protein n=1 Tax=Penicillium manginii TaxID=203109 RepID=UPI002548088A|nr:uncharacterized protein N7533_008959 [Penicillium manginii]KAJ5744089.1 hypothetical protein N7533_008959 [Penicillium manginii]